MVMIVTSTLLVIFFIYQLMLSLIFKKKIKQKDFTTLLVILVLDVIVSLFFIQSIFFNLSPITIRLLNFVFIMNFGILFLFYSKLLKFKNLIKEISFLVVLFIYAFVISFVYMYLTNLTIFIFSIISILAFLLTFDYKQKFSSKYLKTYILLFFFTEFIRLFLINLISFEVAITNIIYPIIGAIFIFKSFSLFFMIEIHTANEINPALASILDHITPSKLLSITYTEHPDAIVLTDKNEKIIFANPQIYKITGYREDEVIGKTPRIFSSGLTDRSVYTNMKEELGKNKTWTGEFINQKKNKEHFIEESKLIALSDINDQTIFYLAIKNDVSKEKHYLNKLEKISNYDTLTNLPRRHYFLELIESNINKDPSLNHFCALIDLDDYKKINDIHGHLVGDEVLTFFADTMKNVFKDYGYACRFGGDEFGIYITDITNEKAISLFSQLIDMLEKTPLPKIATEKHLEISIGLTKVTDKYNYMKVYERTDKLLYQSKKIKGSNIKYDF